MPLGLEDVSKYPALFDALIANGWSRDDLGKLAGENLLRVFQTVEDVRDTLQMDPIKSRYDDTAIPTAELDRFADEVLACRSDYLRPVVPEVPATS